MMLHKISEKSHAWAKGGRVFILFLADALMVGFVRATRNRFRIQKQD